MDIISVENNVEENGNQPIFFLKENGQWRKTVSRFWRKMEPLTEATAKTLSRRDFQLVVRLDYTDKRKYHIFKVT